ncbi:MAG: hypothetical protein K8F58_15860 [Bauldia sp.]|nr:hypothetical protein [Bauldia sp.]
MSLAAPAERRLPVGRSVAPVSMLFLCLCGMAVGLAIDCGAVPPEVLASLCIAATGSLPATAAVHFELLPATHLLMLAGAVRVGVNLATVALMFAGMILGAWLGPGIALGLGIGSSFAGLTGAMVAGMALGMIVAAPLHRYLSRRRGPPATEVCDRGHRLGR